jgi:hypothetical protein
VVAVGVHVEKKKASWDGWGRWGEGEEYVRTVRMRHLSAHIARTYPLLRVRKSGQPNLQSACNALRFSETLSQVVNIGWEKEISAVSNFPRNCDPIRTRNNGAAQKEADMRQNVQALEMVWYFHQENSRLALRNETISSIPCDSLTQCPPSSYSMESTLNPRLLRFW